MEMNWSTHELRDVTSPNANTTLTTDSLDPADPASPAMTSLSIKQVQLICGGYVTAILLVMGLIGNGLIVAVMKREAFKKLPVKVNHEVSVHFYCKLMEYVNM